MSKIIPTKTVPAIILSLAAGFAAGAMLTGPDRPDAGTAAAGGAAGQFDADAPAAARIAALERAVAEEREARLLLEEQMQGLYDAFDRIDGPALETLLSQLQQNRRGESQAAQIVQADNAPRPENMRRRMRDFEDLRKRRLVDGGFTDAQAAGILQLEDDIRMEALQQEYEARRNGDEWNAWEQIASYQDRIRDRLGDDDYARYLEAHGMTASVTVQNVIGSSPASRAGLQPGDRIVSYGGERVFGMQELRNMAFDGAPGEDVIVEVERDGQRLQLVLPRGPMGITGSGGPRGFGYNPYGG